MLRFRVSECISAQRFNDIGRGCAQIIENLLLEQGGIKPGQTILDFGCGCGRIIKWLMRGYPQAMFHGCDIDHEAIQWCLQHLSEAAFHVNGRLPPLSYSSSSFDVIYCFSVFTHLNEAMQDAWLAELQRILKPNGILIVTVHGRNAAKRLSKAEQVTLESYGFLHKKSRKLAGLLPDWYHTTWHSQSYILAKLTPLFGCALHYVEVPDSMQDCVVAGPPALRGTRRPW
jgi:ubiquinone/menaquinone biosynthesis C-methylase UbiE